MDVKEAIEKRRAYRALERVDIEDDTLDELIHATRFTPSCFNNQPWNYVFVRDPDVLEKMKDVMSKGNEWTFRASMIAAVFSKKDDDCIVEGREYHLFDAGQANGFMILRATELGLIAHPIAGFSEKKVKDVLGIPDEYTVITLVIFGLHSDEPEKILEGNTLKTEKERPKRKKVEEFVHYDRY